MPSADLREKTWPALPLESWRDTYATLHMWTQIVGKIRLIQSPWFNHSWHVPLYVTSAGLTTAPDSLRHANLPDRVRFHPAPACDPCQRWRHRQSFELQPQSVAALYRRLIDGWRKLEIRVDIHKMPNEIADPIRFDLDESHRAYDRERVNRFWRILVQADRVMKEFRARFIGKCSPVHVFWGALDIAVTRFSGRTAPQHPGGVPHLPDFVAREAYSHEVSSCGFWPGGGPVPYAAFYAYAYPEPAGFSQVSVKPAAAFYSTDLHEFVLPYDAVREAAAPDQMLLEFFQSTYEAAADLSRWDRAALERSEDPKLLK